MRLHGPVRTAFDLGRRLFERARPRRQTLAGLQSKVEVFTDGFGVPHIYADSAADLFFAQGFITARDRLFQLDYNRHASAGRLCELVGDKPVPWRDLTLHLKERTTFDVDVMLRTFGLARAAEESLPLHSQEARQILEAYAAGVNAYVARAHLTLEHRILRHRPEPWTPVDSLTLIRAIGFELNFAWRAILMSAVLARSGAPPDVVEALWPRFPSEGPSIVDGEAWAELARELLVVREAADAAIGLGNAPGVGSNCFAVAGSHTIDGDALLANDTHLTLVAPGPWHEVRLLGGGFDLHGFALAGLPGIGIGRTPHHAWGITAGLAQDLDLFAEKLNPDNEEEYLTPDGFRPLEFSEETFLVRGQSPRRRKIYSSRHGPLLETVATEAPAGQRFAIAWTGHVPGRDFDALLGMWKAQSFSEFSTALENHVCPNFNISYAGADGRVGYVLAGILPRRKPQTPLRPLEGWTGEWDWDGVIPEQHKPRLFDPACGFVVTANNRLAPRDYPYELGELFEPPERYERITELLQRLGNKVSFEDLASIQCDVYSAWALQLRDALLGIAGGKSALNPRGSAVHQVAVELWSDWDGFASASSPGAAIAIMTAWNTARELVRRLTDEDATHAFLELASFITGPLATVLGMQPRLSELGIDLPAVVRQAFELTIEQCKGTMGEDAAKWAWGRMHPLVCRHRFDATPLGAFFAIGPEPAGGGPDTVNRGDLDGANSFRMRVGAAMRMVVNARGRDQAGTVVPGGQSGDRLSPHYDDQMRLFLAGELKPAPVTKSAVAAAQAETFEPPL